MLAVGLMHDLALPNWLQAGLLHQSAHLVTPDLEAAIGQCCDQATAALTLAAAHERRTQMYACFVKSRLGGTVFGFVKPAKLTQKAAGLCDRKGLHLQRVDEPVVHLSSRDLSKRPGTLDHYRLDQNAWKKRAFLHSPQFF
jgi:hypothetical protein